MTGEYAALVPVMRDTGWHRVYALITLYCLQGNDMLMRR